MEIAKGLRGSGRYTGVVRAARAYLAGFGTTGSLLAGAALMFILATALVAFRGWPHVAAQPSPGEVVLAPHSARSSASARRLAAAAAAPLGGTGAPAVGPGARGPGTNGPGTGGRGTGRRPGGGTVGNPVSTSIPVGTPASCSAAGCGTTTTVAPPPSPVQQGLEPIQQVTNTIGHVVSDTGGKVGTVVQQTANTVAGPVGGASPPVGGLVKGTGTGAAKSVTGVTKALGGIVSGLGGG